MTIIDLNILNNTQTLEKTIKSVWQRNVFFLLWIGLFYIVAFIFSLVHRFCQIPRMVKNKLNKTNITYTRKIYNNKLLELLFCTIENNIGKIFCCLLFFIAISSCKFIYHTAKITWWFFDNVIKTTIWWGISIFATMSLSNAIKTNNEQTLQN